MKVVIAKKEHECSECGKPIPAGSRYWSDYAAPDGGSLGHNRKTHTNCAEHEAMITAAIADSTKGGEA